MPDKMMSMKLSMIPNTMFIIKQLFLISGNGIG